MTNAEQLDSLVSLLSHALQSVANDRSITMDAAKIAANARDDLMQVGFDRAEAISLLLASITRSGGKPS